jgi:hypothetical protein
VLNSLIEAIAASLTPTDNPAMQKLKPALESLAPATPG